MIRYSFHITDAQMDFNSAEEDVPELLSELTDVSNAAIRATAAVKSVDCAFSSTFCEILDICPACIKVPTAPAAPTAKLKNGRASKKMK